VLANEIKSQGMLRRAESLRGQTIVSLTKLDSERDQDFNLFDAPSGSQVHRRSIPRSENVVKPERQLSIRVMASDKDSNLTNFIDDQFNLKDSRAPPSSQNNSFHSVVSQQNKRKNNKIMDDRNLSVMRENTQSEGSVDHLKVSNT
jgi:hypothetical protein